MTIDFLSVFISVISLIIMAVPGFLLQKFKILPEKAGEAFSALVLYGCQPLLVFMSFQKNYSSDVAVNILIVAGLAIVVHLIFFALAFLFIRNKDNSEKKKIVRYAMCFSNCGYMGLPLLTMIFGGSSYGEDVIIYAAMVIAIFNIFNWTVGVYIITQDKKNISLKKIIFNPTLIAVVLGLLYFFIVKQPLSSLGAENSVLDSFLTKLSVSFNAVGDMVTPLSLTVIGMRLANIKLKQLFLDKWSYFVCLLKLVLASIITMLVVSFLPCSVVVKYTLFFLMSMPSATSTTLFAVKFNSDGDSASVFVLLTTVLSIVTIPLMYLMFSGVFGVVIA